MEARVFQSRLILKIGAPACYCEPILFCRFELFEKLRSDRFFERFAWEPQKHIVRVHLDEFEIPSYRWNSPKNRNKTATFSTWQLDTRRCPPFFPFETLSQTRRRSPPGHRTTPTVCDLWTTSWSSGYTTSVILSPRLAFRSTVSQQLEHLCEEGFVWIFVSSAPVLGHFVHEPGEDFLSPVVDGSMNRCDLKTMIEIPS